MIHILLASYNGETYLAEQLDSLLNQTEQDFVIFAQDDRSTDGTYALLCDYAARYPEKIKVSQNAVNSGAAKWNFLNLIANHDADYLMLCDQDDVWRPDKIETTRKAMQEAEHRYGNHEPILVFTDLCVVGEDLQVLHPSFRAMSRLNYQHTEMNRILVQNTLTGCTVLFNRSFRTLLNELPKDCVMHDWWLMLVASAFATILPLENEQTVFYRQHRENVVGAVDPTTSAYISSYVANRQKAKESFNRIYRQAEEFLRIYSGRLSADQKKLLEDFCAIPRKRKCGRILAMLRLKTFKHGVLRVLGQFFYA
ncbi:MAG: glycosyltransferase family 2 protein [Eubacteriales bacterium]|nr:glycosyltransferase family 2 protein [Eubacteriales bacterium]